MINNMLSSSIKTRLIKLKQKKYRLEYNQFLVEGVKGVEDAIKSDSKLSFIVLSKAILSESDFELISRMAKKKRIEIIEITDKDIKTIKSTVTFPGVMAIVDIKQKTIEDFNKNIPIVCLDGIRDPGNLGTIIRTADWFGFQNILLSEDTVDPYNGKVVRSSMGSIFHVKIVMSTDIVQSVKAFSEKGYAIRSMVMAGDPIEKIKKVEKSVYIFGSESHGIRDEIENMGEKFTIKGSGDTESLNVAVASAIVLHHLSR